MENFNRVDALVFVHALRKIAAAPDADLAEHEQAVATGQASTPDEAMQRTLSGQPDPTVRYEGDYAVPPEQIVPVLAQIVSNSMRQHTAYSFYSEMIRGAGRGELAELFEEQGAGELKEMAYFLRRISILSPGGVPIPVAPTPEPTNDVGAALKYLIAGEQQALVLFKTLRSMLGDNPMKYAVEQIMTDAQEHHDKLIQNLPAEKPKSKLASVVSKLSAGIPVGAPGTEAPEVVAQREAMLQQQQMVAENQALRAQVDQVGQIATQQQQQLESLGAENQNLQAQSQMASDQAHMATEQAQMHAEQAANEADAKMRLSIRIQQMRQTLADTVAQDPVQEEGVGFGNPAGPGTIQTQNQNNAMAQEAAMMDPAGAGAAPAKEPKKPAEPKPATKQAGIVGTGVMAGGLYGGLSGAVTGVAHGGGPIGAAVLGGSGALLGAALGGVHGLLIKARRDSIQRAVEEQKARYYAQFTPEYWAREDAEELAREEALAQGDESMANMAVRNGSLKKQASAPKGLLQKAVDHATEVIPTTRVRQALTTAGAAGIGAAIGGRHEREKKETKEAGDYTEGLRLMAKAKKASCVPTVGEVNNGDPKPPRLPLAGMGTEVETRDPQRVDPETSKQHIILAKRK